jgi:hypothetical protein
MLCGVNTYMPYARKGKCVYRKDTGKKVGCSSSNKKAKKYLKKLYAVSNDEETIDDNTLLDKVLSL